VYSTDGTVADYLASQGTALYLAVVERYRRSRDRMNAVPQDIAGEDEAKAAIAADRAALFDALASSDWMDVDTVTTRFCERHGLAMVHPARRTIEKDRPYGRSY
jgi:hypothetical protein